MEPAPMPAARIFDELGEDYETGFRRLPEQHAALGWLAGRLMPGDRVLDIGSGTGRPVAERLAGLGCRVTGIDVSPRMIDVATRHVPSASFLLCDVRGFNALAGTFAAVCAFFPLLQMTRDELDETLVRIAAWLRPGGAFAMATVPGDYSETDTEWMGRPLRMSSYTEPEYRRRLAETGLDVVHTSLTRYEPDLPTAAPEDHLFAYAVKRRE
ncbi:class I SAM-dependent DNA methyltransferase [Actinorhabdospora filicis]|nr:class I SAM-dependent methyltransferase [Actinorhabdospora filicis]